MLATPTSVSSGSKVELVVGVKFPRTIGEAGGRRRSSLGSVYGGRSRDAGSWTCWPARRIMPTLRVRGRPHRCVLATLTSLVFRLPCDCRCWRFFQGEGLFLLEAMTVASSLSLFPRAVLSVGTCKGLCSRMQDRSFHLWEFMSSERPFPEEEEGRVWFSAWSKRLLSGPSSRSRPFAAVVVVAH